MKYLFWTPLHILNSYIAKLSPRWLFRVSYSMSSDAVRQQEQTIRNKARLEAYRLKKLLTNN